MATLSVIVAFCFVLTNQVGGFERSSVDFGIPFPIKTRTEDYYPDLNFDKCGGLVTSPTVISSRKYPFGDNVESCTWRIKTRRCFQPKITLLSSAGYDDRWNPLQFRFNGTSLDFMNKPAGTVYYAPTSEGEIFNHNKLGWNNGYGFQAAIDFIPRSTPECKSTFTDLPSLTCFPSEKVGNDYVIETPGYPGLVPPATGCRQSLPITEALLSYEVTLKSNTTSTARLTFVDPFSTNSVTVGDKTQVFVTTAPMSILYRSGETEISPGFRMEVKDIRAPKPCGTVISVGSTEVVVINPFPTTCSTACAIRFQAPAGQKLKFSYNELGLSQSSTTEFARIYSDFPGMKNFTQVFQGKPDSMVDSDGVFLYKGGSKSTLWKLKVVAV